VGTRRSELCDFAAEMLRRGKVLRLRAQGWSMYPFIKHDDIVEVEPVDSSAIRLGDLVFCRYAGNRLVAHRVVGLNREGGQVILEIKGDSVGHRDRPIYPEQVLGRLIAIERRGRRLRMDGRLRRLTNRLWAWLSRFTAQVCRLPRTARYVARRVVDHASMLW
jgi:hypothetical protein